jgi:3-phosphoshikimate 1-carboxyvinyltransferase
MAAKTSYTSKNLHGVIDFCPDKSISHRSIIIPAISEGVTEITNLLEGEDVLHTIDALRLAGVKIEKQGTKWLVFGKGINSLLEPKQHIYLGNSGTSTRLLAGLLAPYNFTTFFTGDSSLSQRPMARVFKPLQAMGVKFTARQGNAMPFCMQGSRNIMPINYSMEVASAQVKSAILLAACQVQGKTTIIENTPTRNHTENMLAFVGGEIKTTGNTIEINGGKKLRSSNITVPNDPSSAAFLLAIGILCEGSKVTVKNVCTNKTRTGFFVALQKMGANLEFSNQKIICGEEIADITAIYTPNLHGITLDGEISASMIDEYPILFVVASFAKGKSKFHGLEELTAKESNRLKVMAENLQNCGVDCKPDYENFSLEINGYVENNQPANIQTNMDHRIAMSFLIFGLRAKNAITIDDDTYINTSFPNFMKIMKELNANII